MRLRMIQFCVTTFTTVTHVHWVTEASGRRRGERCGHTAHVTRCS